MTPELHRALGEFRRNIQLADREVLAMYHNRFISRLLKALEKAVEQRNRLADHDSHIEHDDKELLAILEGRDE